MTEKNIIRKKIKELTGETGKYDEIGHLLSDSNNILDPVKFDSILNDLEELVQELRELQNFLRFFKN